MSASPRPPPSPLPLRRPSSRSRSPLALSVSPRNLPPPLRQGSRPATVQGVGECVCVGVWDEGSEGGGVHPPGMTAAAAAEPPVRVDKSDSLDESGDFVPSMCVRKYRFSTVVRALFRGDVWQRRGHHEGALWGRGRGAPRPSCSSPPAPPAWRWQPRPRPSRWTASQHAERAKSHRTGVDRAQGAGWFRV
jgi:hypothetical protein